MNEENVPLPQEGETEQTPPAADAAAESPEMAELRRKAAEYDALEERLKRAAADFANAQRRLERDTATRLEYATQDFAREILPVMDNLRRALVAAEKNKDLGALLEGIRLVDKQFHDILGRHGVEMVPAEPGTPLDPQWHDVIAVVPAAGWPANAIVEVVDRGFRMKNRVLRPARVVVAKPEE